MMTTVWRQCSNPQVGTMGGEKWVWDWTLRLNLHCYWNGVRLW